MAAKTTKEVLAHVADTLATAKLGLQDVLSGGPDRRLGGLRNLIVFGRAVTNVLQNLRSTEPAFEAWYEPYVKEMRDDPLLRYFYTLRSAILKQGQLRSSSTLHIKSFSTRDLQRLGPPPPGAKGFFMGDQAGGSGWDVQPPDGSTEKLYVDLPGNVASTEVHLPDAPRKHRGLPIADTRIETLARLYFEYLSAMVKDAQRKFGRVGA